MENLPTENTASRANGFWFVFSHADNTIVAEVSPSKKKEFVYINGQLASEKDSALPFRRHEFAHGDNHYRIVFNVKNLPMGNMACALFVNGKPAKTYRVFLKFRLVKVILCAAMGGACGVIGNYLRWPLWLVTPLTPFMVFVFLVLFKSSQDFVFEEVRI